MQYAENTMIPIDSKNLNKALKCISKLRTPLQDRALRSQLFNKLSNRLLLEIPNLNAMDFILLFVTHRKTFLMEIRHPDTSNHLLYARARQIVNNVILKFYEAAEDKLNGKELTEEQVNFFKWQDGSLNILEDIAVQLIEAHYQCDIV